MCLLAGCISLGVWSLLYGLVKPVRPAFLIAPGRPWKCTWGDGGSDFNFSRGSKELPPCLVFSSACFVSLCCPTISTSVLASLCLFASLPVVSNSETEWNIVAPSAPCIWCTKLSSKLPVDRHSSHHGCLHCPDNKAVNVSELGGFKSACMWATAQVWASQRTFEGSVSHQYRTVA